MNPLLVFDHMIHVQFADPALWNITACSTWNAANAAIHWVVVLPDDKI